MSVTTREQQQRVAVSALRRYETLQRDECMDPNKIDSRPTDKQLDLFQRIQEYTTRICIAGNQFGKCLITGTLVATPNGPKAIEDLEYGDWVYSEKGEKIKVLAKRYQGRQKILPIERAKRMIASATANHRWLAEDGELVYTEDLLDKPTKIKRVQIFPEMGDVHENHAYAIGALLGDGCSRQSQLSISSADSSIPNKVAAVLGEDISVTRSSEHNYTWILQNKYTIGHDHKKVKCKHYDAWCNNRYAHEKVIDIDVISKWDRSSLLALMAGVLDTDGSVSSNNTNPLTLSWSMQAKSVIEAMQWCLRALYLHDVNICVDDREKYKNGPVYILRSTDTEINKLILKELDSHIVTHNKKYKQEYEVLSTRKDFNCRIRSDRIREVDTWDIEVDSDSHLYLLANGYVTHNSTIGGREVAWLCENKHPYLDVIEKWGTEALTILVLGQVGEQNESLLWARKIKPFLMPGTYKEIRIGSMLQRVDFKNGTKIIFISHKVASEARKTVQGYVAHYVWLDEMPDSLSLVAELEMRVVSNNGKLLVTFTPLLRNVDIKNWVEDKTSPNKKAFRFHTLDNPIFKGREAEILAQFEAYPENERRARLYGEWYAGDLAVYDFNPDRDLGCIPEDYSPQWEHLEAVDPAASGNMGFMLLARSPRDLKWYTIKAKYISGAAATDLLNIVEVETAGFNVVRRVGDPNAVWYIKEASKRRMFYGGVRDKNNRKAELIKNTQQAMRNDQVVVTKECPLLVQELVSCQWNEAIEGRIVNSSRFHLLDCFQYGIDNLILKTPVLRPVYSDYMEQHGAEIREANNKRKETERKIRIKRSANRRKSWKVN